MNKIKNALTKLITLLFFVLMALLNMVRNNKERKSNKILLIECGHLGDALIDASSITVLANWYMKNGKEVSVACAPEVCAILRAVDGFPNVTLLPWLDYKLAFNAKKLYQLMKVMRKEQYELLIGLSVNLPSYYYFFSTIPGKKVALIYPEMCLGYRKILYFFFRLFYEMTIFVHPGEHRLEAEKRFLELMNIPTEELKVSKLRLTDHDIHNGKFISIVVDSANTARRWPARYIAELCNDLCEKYQFDIYLLGQKKNEELLERIKSFPAEKRRRIYDFCEKTDFIGWVELIRDSMLIVGVDSGAIHVASSLGTQAFCLSGVWQDNRFVPYPKKFVKDGVKAPICIYRDNAQNLECYNCFVKSGAYGKADPACFAKCKTGEPCLCLENIYPHSVLSIVDSYLQEDN